MSQNTEHTTAEGEGTIKNGEIKSVGAIQGPFKVSIEWDQEAPEADVLAAQEFVKEFVTHVNAGDGSEVPACIKAITIGRI